MVRLVLDSSVVIKWFLLEDYTPEARQILLAYRNGDCQITVPDLLYAEVGNILWKRHVQKGLDESYCQAALHELDALLLPIVPITRLAADAFSLAIAHKRTMYDMLYVALAEREGCPFVTADERLVNAIGAALPSVKWLGKWPVVGV